MFTGIIDHHGQITEMQMYSGHMRLHIRTEFSDLVLGESMAIDGMCVTVANIIHQDFICDISPETMSKTVASTYKKNSIVNLERSLKVGDRMGGHCVTGHVDQIALVNKIESYQEYALMQIGAILPDVMGYLVQKGSVSVNGVSLTINAITQDGFTLMVIPHTLTCTNLSELIVGSKVNIEFDYIAKCVARQVAVNNQLECIF